MELYDYYEDYVRSHPQVARKINNLLNDTDEILEAIGIEMPEDEYQLIDMVQKDPDTLRLINNQTESICLAAIEEDGLALQHVIDQTEKLCLAALSQNKNAIQYVDEDLMIQSVIQELENTLMYVGGLLNELAKVLGKNRPSSFRAVAAYDQLQAKGWKPTSEHAEMAIRRLSDLNNWDEHTTERAIKIILDKIKNENS